MRQSLSDIPSSSSQPSRRHRKRRWTREQLLSNLEILNSLEPPLPPTLPPSPPASRSVSPAPGYKRKSDSFSSDPSSSSSSSSSKRPRTSLVQDRRYPTPQQQHPRHPPQPPHSHQPPNAPFTQPASASNPPFASSSRQEPEEGEVREESLAPVPAPSIPAPPKGTVEVPIRRPKRGKLSSRHFENLHDIYHNQGRALKWSGDARFWSTYPPTHREYRPLTDPPPPNSPYHKYGGLIARLELVDALICFTYSIWNKEYHRRTCNRDSWATMEEFLIWCRHKWQAEEGINDAERAFIGLIWMIEGFIRGRILSYSIESRSRDMKTITNNIKATIAKNAAAAEAGSGASSGASNNSLGTPIMLPSPASIAPANSANSTPTYKDERGNSSNGSNSRPTNSARPQPHPPRPQTGPPPVPPALYPSAYAGNATPVPPHVMDAMAEAREPITPVVAHDLREFVGGYESMKFSMGHSQKALNLPIMMRCFPNTFNRMMHSTLTPQEEHEPDIEDEEGELFWPGQLVTGEGLGWVCLMGKAMIKEFGKAYGYKGLEGVVPKPKPEESADDNQRPTHSGSSSHASHHASNSSHGHR